MGAGWPAEPPALPRPAVRPVGSLLTMWGAPGPLMAPVVPVEPCGAGTPVPGVAACSPQPEGLGIPMAHPAPPLSRLGWGQRGLLPGTGFGAVPGRPSGPQGTDWPWGGQFAPRAAGGSAARRSAQRVSMARTASLRRAPAGAAPATRAAAASTVSAAAPAPPAARPPAEPPTPQSAPRAGSGPAASRGAPVPTTGTATRRPDVAAVPLGGLASAAREVGDPVRCPSPDRPPPRTRGAGSRQKAPYPSRAVVPGGPAGPALGDRAVLQPVTVGAGDPTAATPATAAQATGAATPPPAGVCARPATRACSANSVSPGRAHGRALRVRTRSGTREAHTRAHVMQCDMHGPHVHAHAKHTVTHT